MDKTKLVESSSKQEEEHASVSISLYTSSDQWILISFALLYVATLATEILPQIQRMEFERDDHLLVMLIFCLPLIYLFTRPSIRGRKALHPITLDQHSLRCPVKIGSRKYIRINYDQVDAVDSRGTGKSAFHVIRAKGCSIHFPAMCFDSREDWQLLMHTLINRISKLPDGTQRIALFMRQNRLGHSIFSRIPKFLLGLLCIIGATFLLQCSYKVISLHNLAGIGANSALLLGQGEFFRLFSSSFLHAGILHFSLNFLGLLGLGYIVEGCLGPLRTAIIYFFSVLFGTLISGIGGATLSVGASAGIFGLLAAFAVINLRFYQSLPAGISMSQRWWIIVTAVNLILPVLIPKIDQAAHIGGLLTGGALTWLMLRGEELGLTPAVLKKWEQRSLMLVVLLMTLAFAQSLPYWIDSNKRLAANLMISESFIKSSKNSPPGLEMFAREIYSEENPRPVFLSLADSALQEAIKSDPDNLAFNESLAELRHSQKRTDEAVVLLHRLLRLSITRSGNQLFLANKLVEYIPETSSYKNRKSYSQNIKIDPKSTQIRLNPGIVQPEAILLLIGSAHKPELLLSLSVAAGGTSFNYSQLPNCRRISKKHRIFAINVLSKDQLYPNDSFTNKCLILP